MCCSRLIGKKPSNRYSAIVFTNLVLGRSRLMSVVEMTANFPGLSALQKGSLESSLFELNPFLFLPLTK